MKICEKATKVIKDMEKIHPSGLWWFLQSNGLIDILGISMLINLACKAENYKSANTLKCMSLSNGQNFYSS